MARGSGYFRWTVCALLFFATVINYVDRQVLGLLAPMLQRSIGWTEVEYGYIVTSFQAAYAAGMLAVGGLLDRFGTRAGFAVAMVFWSLATMAHAGAGSAFGFGVARAALGLGESANFPASIKAVAEWFPRKERALATGIFNAGANVGAIVGPLLVPWLVFRFGLSSAFLVTGAIGFVWLVFWWALYGSPEGHPRVSAGELAHIRSDAEPPAQKVAWARLLSHRQTWAFAAAKFLTDPIWWFYLYWLPKFLNERHGLTLAGLSGPLVAVYLAADVGSVGGGWLSSQLLRRGASTNAARKTAMLVCALAVTPIAFASRTENLWTAVALVSLAAAAHQGWSANVFTLASDMFPRGAVASVVGIGGMAGAMGGMLLAAATGHILEWSGSYLPMMLMAALNYLLALAIVHAILPRLEPAKLD
jgi:ACS family hexuronate transporter-like MFS transporter